MRILDLARILRFFGYTMKYASLMTKPIEWYFPLEEGQNKRKRCCRVFGNIRHSNNDHLQSYNRDNKLFYTKYCQFLQIMSQFFSAKYSIFAILKFHFVSKLRQTRKTLVQNYRPAKKNLLFSCFIL